MEQGWRRHHDAKARGVLAVGPGERAGEQAVVGCGPRHLGGDQRPAVQGADAGGHGQRGYQLKQNINDPQDCYSHSESQKWK